MYMQNATSILSLPVPVAIRITNIDVETFVPDTIQVTCLTARLLLHTRTERLQRYGLENLEYYNHRHSHEFTDLLANLRKYIYAYIYSRTST
jgi:hypothetical protein